ncbi:MAG: hypothetical protein GY757_19860, partial [bacterium]|nr:hypothetical protein [bacterium]
MSRFQALKEIKQEEKAFNKIRQLLPEYEGAKLEDLVKRIFIEINPFHLEFTSVGRYWDRKGENEIEIVEKKTGKVRRITMNKTCMEAITNLLSSNSYDDEDYLF